MIPMLEIFKQKGFALPSSIFLLVILAMLSTALLAVSVYSQKSTIYDVLDTKAYFIAKAGVEYGAYLASKNGACSSTPQTVSVSEQHLEGFKFTITCTERTVNEAGLNQTYYTITSYGCNSNGSNCPDTGGRPGSETYVEKSLVVVIAKE